MNTQVSFTALIHAFVVAAAFLTVTFNAYGFEFIPLPEKPIVTREMSLTNRYPLEAVNNVFADNIRLNIAYLSGQARTSAVTWDEIKAPTVYEIVLKSGEVFAFHEDVLPQYQGKVVKTTNAHFNAQEGFLYSGKYFGDGVCHLASLLYWAAKDAGLAAYAPTNHDFAAIPDIPREYGVSIYYTPGNYAGNALQNLYIENTFAEDIIIRVEQTENSVVASVVKAS
jgi:hypothetical protein